MLVEVNLKIARDRQHKVIKEIPKCEFGDLVLLRNHKKHIPWNAKHVSNFSICRVINDRVYALQDPSGHVYHDI